LNRFTEIYERVFKAARTQSKVSTVDLIKIY